MFGRERLNDVRQRSTEPVLFCQTESEQRQVLLLESSLVTGFVFDLEEVTQEIGQDIHRLVLLEKVCPKFLNMGWARNRARLVYGHCPIPCSVRSFSRTGLLDLCQVMSHKMASRTHWYPRYMGRIFSIPEACC